MNNNYIKRKREKARKRPYQAQVCKTQIQVRSREKSMVAEGGPGLELEERHEEDMELALMKG